MKNILATIIFLFILVMLGFFVWLYRTNTLEIKKLSINPYTQNQMESCYNYKKPDRKKCYESVATNLLARYSLPEILKVFDSNENKIEFFKNCHEVAHYLGQQEYKRLKNVRDVLLESSRACLGGTYHGAVEGYFMESNISTTPENELKIREKVRVICGKTEDYIRPQDFIECNHGLGHATIYIADYDLPRALDYCDALRSKNERELCYSGALMANSDSFGDKEHPTKYIKDDDLLYPCNILKEHQQKQCYTYGVLARFQYDLPKSIALCKAVPTSFQTECFKTLGRDRTMISADPEELKSQCSQIKEKNFKKDCISGTSYNLVIRFGIDSDIPIDYCKITDPEFKDICYPEIWRALKKITTDVKVRENFCRKISESDYKNKCLNSII